MNPQYTNNDAQGRDTASAAARRELRSLSPRLYQDVMEFARSGREPDPGTIERWLERNGRIGFTEATVRLIRQYHPQAVAIISEHRPVEPEKIRAQRLKDGLCRLIRDLELGSLTVQDLDPRLVAKLRDLVRIHPASHTEVVVETIRAGVRL